MPNQNPVIRREILYSSREHGVLVDVKIPKRMTYVKPCVVNGEEIPEYHLYKQLVKGGVVHCHILSPRNAQFRSPRIAAHVKICVKVLQEGSYLYLDIEPQENQFPEKRIIIIQDYLAMDEVPSDVLLFKADGPASGAIMIAPLDEKSIARIKYIKEKTAESVPHVPILDATLAKVFKEKIRRTQTAQG